MKRREGELLRRRNLKVAATFSAGAEKLYRFFTIPLPREDMIFPVKSGPARKRPDSSTCQL
jgi:hypothetical protein